MQRKSEVLSDHKRVGKRFIPPMLQTLKLDDISWVDHGIPELVWIGLLHQANGLKQGTDLALSVARACADTVSHPPLPLFSMISAYRSLDRSQRAQVVAGLDRKRKLGLIREALAPLVSNYPECPLYFLFRRNRVATNSGGSDLESLKAVVEALFDRLTFEATMVQVNALYVGAVTGKIKFCRGTGFDEIEPVVSYPTTEESRRIAADTRAFLNVCLGADQSADAVAWRSYFWNRGLELEPCELEADK
jgi:hypothetical protein